MVKIIYTRKFDYESRKIILAVILISSFTRLKFNFGEPIQSISSH